MSEDRRQKKEKVGVYVFCVVFAIFGILGLILPLRPSISELEKRELTKFPDFSIETFWDGSWCSDISLWYADTFPFRDQLLSCNSSLEGLYGIRTKQIHGTIGSGDEIPDVPDTPKKTSSDAKDSDRESTSSIEETQKTTEKETEEATEETIETIETIETQATADSNNDTTNTVVGEKVGAVYVVGNTGYEVYYFSREAADIYIEAVNRVADALEGTANVYVMLPPTAFGMYIDSETAASLDGSSESKAEKYYLGSMNENVHGIYLYDAIAAHKDEYIFFRTDHHWTADGAYYAYEQFAKEKGMKANKRENFETKVFEGFLGSFYSGTNQAKELGATPDTITAYVPSGTNLIQITEPDGNELKWYVINDVTSYRESQKYSCFIGGDNPISVIENPDLDDGSACVVVKDSYGNAFVPYLVDHYQTVYVLDYRYYPSSFTDFVRSHEVQDVIFINNLSSSGSKEQMEQFEAKMTE